MATAANYLQNRTARCDAEQATLYAMPVLNAPLYQFAGQQIAYGKRFTHAFICPPEINLAYLHYDRVCELLRHAIEERIVDLPTVKALIAQLAQGRVNEVIDFTFEQMAKVYSGKFAHNLSEIKDAASRYGIAVEDFHIGHLDYTEGYCVFDFDDILTVWVIDVTRLPLDIARMAIQLTRFVGHICGAGCALDLPSGFGELFYTLESLSEDKQRKLIELNTEEVLACEYVSRFKAIVQDDYEAITSEFLSYHEIDPDKEPSEFVEQLREPIDQLSLNQNPLFTGLDRLDFEGIAPMLGAITKRRNKASKTLLPVLDVLSNVANTLLSAYQPVAYQFTYLGDIYDLDGVQFLCFDSPERNHLLASRLDEAGNYLMETGERALVRIDNHAAFFQSMKNHQLGWYLLYYLETQLTKDYRSAL